MVVQFHDNVAGSPVYLNPEYVVSVRPDPENPDHSTLVKLKDGEHLRVRGEHTDVAKKLASRAA